MSSNSNGGSARGISFFGLLGLVFIVLKIIGIIKLSWLWVLCPLWAPIIIYMLVYLMLYLYIRR